MTTDRRNVPRLTRPLEATWHGASGGTPCRLVDLSWGGCFVQTLAQPTVGEVTVVTAEIEGETVRLSGVAVYAEKGIGFGMKFNPLSPEQVDVLRKLLGDPPADVS